MRQIIRFTVCLLVATSLAATAAAASLEEHADAMRARLAAMSNVTVKYQLTNTRTPHPADRAAIEKANADPASQFKVDISEGTMITHEVFRRAGQNFRLTATRAGEPDVGMLSSAPKRSDIVQVDGDKKWLIVDNTGRQHKAKWDYRFRDSLIDVALGMRMRNIDDWLDPAVDLQPGSLTLNEDKTVDLIFKDRLKGEHTLTCDPAKDYAVVRYRYVSEPPAVVVDVRMSDFQKINGRTLPLTVTEVESHTRKGVTQVIRNRELKVTSYILNDPDNTAENLKLANPAAAP